MSWGRKNGKGMFEFGKEEKEGIFWLKKIFLNNSPKLRYLTLNFNFFLTFFF